MNVCADGDIASDELESIKSHTLSLAMLANPESPASRGGLLYVAGCVQSVAGCIARARGAM